MYITLSLLIAWLAGCGWLQLWLARSWLLADPESSAVCALRYRVHCVWLDCLCDCACNNDIYIIMMIMCYIYV